MATRKERKVESIEAGYDWLARDNLKGCWIVNIPTHGGHKDFHFAQYGGVAKAYKEARKYQEKMLKQLERDREYYRKHGEYPDHGPALNKNNTSGYKGVSRSIHPNRYNDPLIVWTAQWRSRGRTIITQFSTAQYPESECKRLALLAYEHKTKYPQTLLNQKIKKSKKR